MSNNLSCATPEPLAPIYLSVRRENLLHIGIGNPDDPLDFDSISSNIMVYSNDFKPPFVRVIATELSGDSITINPCGNGNTYNIPVNIQGCRVIASGNHSVLLVSQTKNLAVDYYQQFLALDQIVDYSSVGSNLPSNLSFDIDISLANGGPQNPNYIGFVFMDFHLDNPNGDPNGLGTYFFVINPSAKIRYID